MVKWIIIISVIFLMIVYLISFLTGLEISVLSLASLAISVATMTLSIGSAEERELRSLDIGSKEILDILGDDRIIPVWESIYGEVDKNEMEALRLLQIVDIANKTVDRTGSDAWYKIVREWFQSPIMYNTWKKYESFFQENTNDIFRYASM